MDDSKMDSYETELPESPPPDAKELWGWVKKQHAASNRSAGRNRLLAAVVSMLALATGGLGTWLILQITGLNSTIEQGKKDIRSVASGVPIGCVIAWPSDAAVPAGWERCQGQEIPYNKDLQDLWSRIRGLYDNMNTDDPKVIKLPNFTGCFLRGAGGHALAIGTQQSDATALPEKPYVFGGGKHAHQFSSRRSAGGNTNQPVAGDGAGVWADGAGHGTGSSDSHEHTLSGGDDETRPVNYAVHWIMRVK